MKSRARLLCDKSLTAMLAALDTYNRPSCPHRTDTFAILAVTSWELLLKARLLQLSNNKIAAITEYERKKTSSGKQTKKLYKKKNRAGNYMTIGLFKAYDRITNDYRDSIDPVVRSNLEALVEIRDNAVHFVNDAPDVAVHLQQVATAALKNFVHAIRTWFGEDLNQYNIFLMPLAFFRNDRTAEVLVSQQEARLIAFIDSLRNHHTNDDETNDFNFILRIDVSFQRGGASETTFKITNDDGATPIRLEERNIRDTHPWTYQILSTRLKARYGDFKADKKYHSLRKALELDSKFCIVRLLDPGNPKSGRKTFFSPNIVSEFDKHYVRRQTSIPAPSTQLVK